MKIFKVKDGVEIVCKSENTRYGFRHLASFFVNGEEVSKEKCCYYNRTWESYEFESVIRKLLEVTDVLTNKEKETFLEKQIDIEHGKVEQEFKTIATISKLGEVFSGSKKESNDWKTRMLKAGLEGKGLIMPEDWDTLDEDTKEARLDLVIGQLQKVGGE